MDRIIDMIAEPKSKLANALITAGLVLAMLATYGFIFVDAFIYRLH